MVLPPAGRSVLDRHRGLASIGQRPPLERLRWHRHAILGSFVSPFRLAFQCLLTDVIQPPACVSVQYPVSSISTISISSRIIIINCRSKRKGDRSIAIDPAHDRVRPSAIPAEGQERPFRTYFPDHWEQHPYFRIF